MIDINELREKITIKGLDVVADTDVLELLDRLEATEEDRSNFILEMGKLCAQCDALCLRIKAAEKERDDVAWQLAQSEQGKRKISEECDVLRAKVAEMEKQEPAYWGPKHAIEGGSTTVIVGKFPVNPTDAPLYALPGAQQCKNCNGMGDRFDSSGEKIPCDLCESHLEEIRALVAEAAHDIVSGGDFWLSISLAAKKIYTLPGAKGEGK